MGMIAVIVCGTAFAGNLNEIKASAVSDDDLSTSTPDKIVSTFYGSKASANANNPCKGATIRKCGTIESSLVSFEDQTSETKANIKLETMKLGGTFKANVEE